MADYESQFTIMRGERDRWRDRAADLEITLVNIGKQVGAEELAPPEVIEKAVVDEFARLRRVVTDRDRLSQALTEAVAGREALRIRQDELLATIVRISKETPLPGEALELRGQVAALIAEVGTLRARLNTLESWALTVRSSRGNE